MKTDGVIFTSMTSSFTFMLEPGELLLLSVAVVLLLAILSGSSSFDVKLLTT
jgi:hypothetical protein